MRGGDEGIIAPVDIESEALRALAEHIHIPMSKPFGIEIDKIRRELWHVIRTLPRATVLLTVGRTVASPRRPDPQTLTLILLAMCRGDDVRVLGHENLPRCVDAARIEHLQLIEKLDRIYDAAVPDNTLYAEKDAGWYLMRNEFLSIMKNRVAGIRTAVVAEHVGVRAGLAKIVGNLALAAIPVLEIDDNISREIRHVP